MGNPCKCHYWGILFVIEIGNTHEAQYTFRMLGYEKRPFNRKDKVSSFILPEILVKKGEINKTTL